MIGVVSNVTFRPNNGGYATCTARLWKQNALVVASAVATGSFYDVDDLEYFLENFGIPRCLNRNPCQTHVMNFISFHPSVSLKFDLTTSTSVALF